MSDATAQRITEVLQILRAMCDEREDGEWVGSKSAIYDQVMYELGIQERRAFSYINVLVAKRVIGLKPITQLYGGGLTKPDRKTRMCLVILKPEARIVWRGSYYEVVG